MEPGVRRTLVIRAPRAAAVMRAYRVVEETADAITYRYEPIVGYWLYAGALLLAVGYAGAFPMLDWIGLLLVGSYVAIIYVPAVSDARRIKAAMRTGSVTMTGSRWSISKPLTIVVPRDAVS